MRCCRGAATVTRQRHDHILQQTPALAAGDGALLVLPGGTGRGGGGGENSKMKFYLNI